MTTGMLPCCYQVWGLYCKMWIWTRLFLVSYWQNTKHLGHESTFKSLRSVCYSMDQENKTINGILLYLSFLSNENISSHWSCIGIRIYTCTVEHGLVQNWSSTVHIINIIKNIVWLRDRSVMILSKEWSAGKFSTIYCFHCTNFRHLTMLG